MIPPTGSLVNERSQSRLGNSRWRGTLRQAVIMLLSLSMMAFYRPDASPAPDDDTFLHLMATGQGDAALQRLADLADQRGGWGPAPGDRVAFAPTMLLDVASVIAIDLPPQDCVVLDAGRDRFETRSPDCGRDFQYEQNLVRFGPATFAVPLPGGTFGPRAGLDDVLSVYIEEVGHSWQEYCYETEGRCRGDRTRPTTWGEGKQRAAGWEYQIKMYILNLDRTWLALSDAERAELTGAICAGYADPHYAVVSEYGPPPGWPNPPGWPTSAPTPDEFQALCNRS